MNKKRKKTFVLFGYTIFEWWDEISHTPIHVETNVTDNMLQLLKKKTADGYDNLKEVKSVNRLKGA